MAKYYTKCGREFEKSSKAVVTGYQVPVMFGPDKPPEGEVYSGCEECPFLIDVKEGWGENAKHKRWECRAGSEPPNHTNDYRGSADDKNVLHIDSLDHEFLKSVIAFVKDHPELSSGYNADSRADCRRTLAIYPSPNKKGMTAKRELIDKFFPAQEPTPDPNVDPDDAAAAAASKICGNCFHRVGGTCSEESQPRTRVKYDQPGCDEHLYDSSAEQSAAPVPADPPAAYKCGKCSGLMTTDDKGYILHVQDDGISTRKVPIEPNSAFCDWWDDREKRKLIALKVDFHPDACPAWCPRLTESVPPAGEPAKIEQPSEDTETVGSPPVIKPIVPDLPPAAKMEQVSGFDYGVLDEPTADTLHMCESRIARIKMQTVYDLGQHLKIANDALANHGSGTFGAWCESIGFSRQSAQNYMQAYEFICQNFDKPEQAVGIQSSLLFAASKPSAPAELAQAVVDGDITKHKDYILAMEQLRKVEKLAEERRHSINAMQEIANHRSSLEQHLRGQIDHANSEASKAYRQAEDAERRVEQAKRNGDPEKLAELGDLIREKQELLQEKEDEIRDLNAQLNSRPIEVKAAEVKEVVPEEMVEAWRKSVHNAISLLSKLDESDITLLVRAEGLENYPVMKGSYRMMVVHAAENMQALEKAIVAAAAPYAEFIRQMKGA